MQGKSEVILGWLCPVCLWFLSWGADISLQRYGHSSDKMRRLFG